MTVSYQWLGQAGFLFERDGVRIIIDPYLSDSLAEKYRGTRFPHQRMAPPPIRADELDAIDWVLCTHQHTDHMDAQTLLPIHQRNADCRFLVPRAWESKVREMGISSDRIHTVDAGESMQLTGGIALTAIPAAHEEMRFTDAGYSWFLGYIIRFQNTALYHSGDCIPYEGLRERLVKFEIDTAFLPVNGRDATRQENGIPGNFTPHEAANLCIDAGIPTLVCHHFNMFDFNTVHPRELESMKARLEGQLHVVIPELSIG
ncbi:MBL fold metallo-hydrolase [Parapedobacter sp.]